MRTATHVPVELRHHSGHVEEAPAALSTRARMRTRPGHMKGSASVSGYRVYFLVQISLHAPCHYQWQNEPESDVRTVFLSP